MNKFLIAAAATFFAVATFFGTTGAQAGAFNAHLSAPKGFSSLHKAGCKKRGFRRRHAIQSIRRAQQKKAYLARKRAIAAKKRAIAQAQAKAAAKAKAAKLAQAKAEAAKQKAIETAAVDTENSSIATVDGDVETEKTEQKVAVAKELGCKQFFPSVGMTLTVPCE